MYTLGTGPGGSTSLLQPVRDWLNSAWTFFDVAFEKIMGVVKDIWEATWNLALDLLQQLMTYIMSLVPQAAKDVLNAVPWVSMREFMDGVNWFIPIYGLLAVILSTYGIVGSIRLVRWIKSFVPTIGD